MGTVIVPNLGEKWQVESKKKEGDHMKRENNNILESEQKYPTTLTNWELSDIVACRSKPSSYKRYKMKVLWIGAILCLMGALIVVAGVLLEDDTTVTYYDETDQVVENVAYKVVDRPGNDWVGPGFILVFLGMALIFGFSCWGDWKRSSVYKTTLNSLKTEEGFAKIKFSESATSR